MSVADLLAEHGSPLWLANLDVVRDRQRSFTAAWRAEWPDVEIAYSHKANRLPAILRTLAEKGIGHQVACEAEYCLARSVADADGRSIVVRARPRRRPCSTARPPTARS
jgi:diaminopimelate decarboxylase